MTLYRPILRVYRVASLYPLPFHPWSPVVPHKPCRCSLYFYVHDVGGCETTGRSSPGMEIDQDKGNRDIQMKPTSQRELGYSRSYATFLYSSWFLWVRFTAFFDSNGYFHEKRLARSRGGSIRSRSIGYLYHVHDIQFQQLATLLILTSFRGLHESNRD